MNILLEKARNRIEARNANRLQALKSENRFLRAKLTAWGIDPDIAIAQIAGSNHPRHLPNAAPGQS